MEKKGNIFLLAMLLFLSANITNAQNSAINKQSELGFIENKGQVYDQNYKPNASVKYLFSSNSGLNVQLKSSGFSYDTYVVERKPIKSKDPRLESINNIDNSAEEVTYRFHRIDVELVGANPNAEMMAEEPSSDFINYYTPGTPAEKGVLGLHKYKKVTYKEIYPGIDLEFFIHQSGDKQVEYNFVVKDNGDINQIKLKYTGQNGYMIGKDKITIQTAHGAMSEMIPSSWIKETKAKQVVEYKVIAQNENNFTVGLTSPIVHKKGETLIIDPAPMLEWGTYFGGTGDEWLVKMSIDPLTNDIYATGNSNSTTLATAGVYQTTISGYDAILVKLNENGVRQWCTYFGGLNTDGAHGVAFDLSGGVSIIGRTNSNSNISTLGSVEPIYPGQPGEWATFIARFNNTNGARIWSTYYGVNDLSWGQTTLEGNPPAIAVSPTAIYVTSSSYTDTHIIAGTPIQGTNAGGADITIAKFGFGGNIIWGTYYGTTGNEYGLSICIDGSENVYIGGKALQNGLATSGAFKQSFGGDIDALLLKLNSSGARQWATYYGSAGADWANGVAYAPIVNLIYIGGPTTSIDSIASAGAYISAKPGSSYSGFLACFNTSGARQWGTYIGGASTEIVYGVTTTCGGDAVVTLESQSAGLSTANAYQSTIAGTAQDLLLARFNPLGVRQWATYYGGSAREFCSDVKINNKLKILVCGKTGSASSISTPNGYQPVFGGSTYDGFIAQFNEVNIAGTKTVCQNSTLSLNAEFSTTALPASVSYAWSGPGGVTGNSATLSVPNIQLTNAGLYTLTITLNGCSYVRTDSIKVNPAPAATASVVTPICLGDSVKLNSSGGVSYSWTGPNGYSSTDQNPIINPVTAADSGLYTVIVTNIFTCKDTADINVVVHDNPIPIISSNSPLCAYDSIQLTSGGGVSYAWVGVNTFGSTLQNPIIHTSDTTLSGNYAVVVTNEYGCTSSANTTVEVKSNPKPILFSNSPVCTSDSFNLVSPTIAQTYTWTGPLGYSSSAQSETIINANSAMSGFYTHGVTYANGCHNNDSIAVLVWNNPTLSVSSDTAICLYQAITVSVSGASTYSWNNGFTSSSYLIYPTMDTVYRVVGTDTNGCKTTDSVIVVVRPFIPVSILQNPEGTLFKDQVATYTALPSGYTNYSFYLNDQLVQNSSSNTYTPAALSNNDSLYVVVSEANMCFSIPEFGVRVIDIYNSFSPNNDGVNDLFLKGYQVTVFNRWGDVVYEGFDGWDGKYHGEDMNTGTYYFTIKYYTADNTEINYKGNLMLVR